VALRQNRPKPGRPPTGLVALRVQVENQRRKPVLDFWRCPMIPLRDPEGDTGHADSFDDIPADFDIDRLAAEVPWGWRLSAFKDRLGRAGAHFADVVPGTTFEIEGRDTVTGATELARATLNIASAHTDPAAGPNGRRLVYGGHTISLAGAATTRALPNLVTILGWRSCDHTAPVFEGDVLRTEVTVEAVHPLSEGGMVELHAVVRSEEQPVLDWRFIALMA
jgi:acyl dehydratase